MAALLAARPAVAPLLSCLDPICRQVQLPLPSDLDPDASCMPCMLPQLSTMLLSKLLLAALCVVPVHAVGAGWLLAAPGVCPCFLVSCQHAPSSLCTLGAWTDALSTLVHTLSSRPPCRWQHSSHNLESGAEHPPAAQHAEAIAVLALGVLTRLTTHSGQGQASVGHHWVVLHSPGSLPFSCWTSGQKALHALSYCPVRHLTNSDLNASGV